MRITIVGTGTMGSGVAYVSAVAGFDTIINDISTELLDEALGVITGYLEAGVERGKIEPKEKEQALARLRLEQDLAGAVDGVGLVIEAVPEDIKLKCKIFGRLDKITPPTAVLATNSSSLSITEVAAATNSPARVIGMQSGRHAEFLIVVSECSHCHAPRASGFSPLARGS